MDDLTMATTEPSPPAAADQTPFVTVVICTRNRAAQLVTGLTSMSRLRVPADLQWELLVVDNGSSDNTGEVARSFASKLPLRVTREETPGLANARNRGLAEARGRYICWTDDDVMVDEGWLEGYVAAFRAYPDGVVFGGPINTILEGPTPRWFARLATVPPLSDMMAHDFGDKPIPLDFDTGVIPWGSSYAVRTAEQRQALYDPELGHSPLHKRISEETDAMHRMLQGGAQGWWAPDAKVQHIFPPRRQNLAFLYNSATAHGETVAYMRTRPEPYQHGAPVHAPRSSLFIVLRSYALAGANAVLFGLTWVVGARAQSLDFLSRTGYHVGAARYAKASLRRR
jgi:glycosyltransferase involved in cell wall biosynthesis